MPTNRQIREFVLANAQATCGSCKKFLRLTDVLAFSKDSGGLSIPELCDGCYDLEIDWSKSLHAPCPPRQAASRNA